MRTIITGVHTVPPLWQDPAERVPRLPAIRHVRGLPVSTTRATGQQWIRHQVFLY
jgi:hypothetical protein